MFSDLHSKETLSSSELSRIKQKHVAMVIFYLLSVYLI